MSSLLVPVSAGELLDKIIILEIKRARIVDATKRANVGRELAALEKVWAGMGKPQESLQLIRSRLRQVNELLWDVEDALRAKEQAQAFDAEFVALARSVYFHNDERAQLKRQVNAALSSELVEEKQYVAYAGTTTRRLAT